MDEENLDEQTENVSEAEPLTEVVSPEPVISSPDISPNEAQPVPPSKQDVGSKEPDSYYMLHADGLAILKNAPDLETGMQFLEEAYNAKDWDNRDKAKALISEYAQDLRYRFGDLGVFSAQDTGKLEPVRFSEVQVEGLSSDASDKDKNLNRIDNWVKMNKEVLAQSEDIKHILNRTKLEKSIDQHAEQLRRYARYGEGNTILNATEDALVRLAEGATAAPSELLLGRNNAYERALRERTDPAYDDDYGTAILGGVGTFEAAALSGPASPAYLIVSGAGATRNRFQEAFQETGDETKAWQAATVEGISQTILLGGLGKIKGGAKSALDKTIEQISEPLFKRIIKPVAIGVGTQVVGGEGSQVSEAIATAQPYHFDPDAALKRASLGAVFGAVGAGAELLRPKVKADPLIKNGGVEPAKEKSVLGTDPISEAPSSVTIGKSTPELEYSARLGEIETAQKAWTPQQTEAAGKAKETFRELDRIQSQIETLSKRKDETSSPTEKKRIQAQIDNHQKAYGELATEVEAGSPGVLEAATLLEKDLLAKRIKEERLKGIPVTGIPETKISEEQPVEAWSETIPVAQTEEAPEPKGFFKTADGSQYYFSPFGPITRVKDGRSYFSPDNTFFVDSKTAKTLGLTRDYTDQSGIAVRIFTDGHRLLVRGTDGEITEVPVLRGPEIGSHPVEVNTPKKAVRSSPEEPQTVEYRSLIGHEITEVQGLEPSKETGEKSAGAMDITALPPRAVGTRIEASSVLNERVRDAFRARPGVTVERYWPVTNVETNTETGKIIAEKGIPKATSDYLNNKPDLSPRHTTEMGHQLLRLYSDAAEAARIAGDLETYEKYSDISIDIGKRLAEHLTELGQGVQQAITLRDLNPDMAVAGLRGKLNEAALREVASKEGYKPEDLRQTVELETQVDEDIAKLTKLKEVKGELSDAQREKLEELQRKKAEISALKDKMANAKKKHQTKLSVEDEKFLRSMLKIFPNLRQGTSQYNRVVEEIQKITNKVTPPSRGWLLSYWISNALSSLATHGVNILGTGALISDVGPAMAVAGAPKVASEYMKGQIGALRGSLELGKRAFLTGQAKSRAGAEDTKFQTREDLVKTGPKGIRYLGYFLRALSGEDEFMYHDSSEAYTRAATYYYGVKEGLTKEALRQKVAEVMDGSPEAWKEAEIESRNMAKLINERAGREVVNEADIRNTTWEIMESKRPDFISKDAHRFALQQTLNGPQRGFLGYIAKTLQQLTEAPLTVGNDKYGYVTVRPLKYLAPFMRIGGTLANAVLDYAGAGYIRSAMGTEMEVHGYNKVEFVKKPLFQRRVELGRAILGTLGMATLYGLSDAYQKDKNPYFALYGGGPKSADTRAQLKQQKNWQPYSIKIGSVLIPYKWTPYVFALGAIGAIQDEKRWNKNFDPASEKDKLELAVGGALGAYTDNSFLKTIGDILAVVQNEPGRSIEDIPINVAKTFIPASAALRAISNITDNPIVTKKDLWAKIVSGIPFAQSLGTKPALNVFGEPIPKTLAERLSFNRLWNTETDDPDFQWLAHNGYDLPDAGNSDVSLELGKKSVQEKRTENYGALFADHLTPKERYELTEKSGPDIRKIISKYREIYGNSGFSQRVQDRLRDDITTVRQRWKRRLFLH